MELTVLSSYPFGTAFIIGILSFLLLLWYSSRKMSYWKDKGIPYCKPYPFVGCIIQNMFYPQHEVENERYKKLGPLYGHYEGHSAVISVADPKLLRDILVKDFQYFANRRTFNANDDVMDAIVANLEDEEWKRVRTIITPTFTTGKLKRMLGIFQESSMTLVHNFKNAAKEKKPINTKIMFGSMGMDVIASSAFSNKIQSYNDPENEFVKMVRKVFAYSNMWRFILMFMAPDVMKMLRIALFAPEPVKFFKGIIEQMVSERKRLNQTRNDFLQLLIDTEKEVNKEQNLENTDKEGDITSNYGEVGKLKVFSNISKKHLSKNELIAQCVIFFLAGYEPTSFTLSMVCYFLAINPEVQEKARQEIKQCLEESKGEISYEAIQSMKYLDNIISETLRYYPPGIRLERKANVDYKLGDTGITVKKGMIVTIPTCSIHMDPKYFPNPQKFDPDRFTPEEKTKRNPYVYAPFGAGPRNCIGMRFALLEVKVCLIHVISYFNIKRCSQTQVPLKFRPGVAALQPHEIYLEMEPRDDCILEK